MEATELRELQRPHKERYREDPGAALITLTAQGELNTDRLTCKVETGETFAEAGLHPATGGSGLDRCSGDMLLEALAGCAGVTLSAVATALGVGTVTAEGDLDFRGTLGVSKDAPVGFQEIRLRFDLDTEAAGKELDKLLDLTERYCVVFQTLQAGPAVRLSYRVTGDEGGAAQSAPMTV